MYSPCLSNNECFRSLLCVLFVTLNLPNPEWKRSASLLPCLSPNSCSSHLSVFPASKLWHWLGFFWWFHKELSAWLSSSALAKCAYLPIKSNLISVINTSFGFFSSHYTLKLTWTEIIGCAGTTFWVVQCLCPDYDTLQGEFILTVMTKIVIPEAYLFLIYQIV